MNQQTDKVGNSSCHHSFETVVGAARSLAEVFRQNGFTKQPPPVESEIHTFAKSHYGPILSTLQFQLGEDPETGCKLGSRHEVIQTMHRLYGRGIPNGPTIRSVMLRLCAALYDRVVPALQWADATRPHWLLKYSALARTFQPDRLAVTRAPHVPEADLVELVDAANEVELAAIEAGYLPPKPTPETRTAPGGESSDVGKGDSKWLTITDAGKISAVNRGVISRAANNGEIKTNGKTGRERLLDSADFNRWILERASKLEPQESDVAVRKKLAQANG